ncbi:MAG: enoyl-CoA hydratase-related protein [Alphaproteobacteria bacterium]|nr:enoyl-CoA hydratase-related protein [Alphaproteobacteria bacterium]
MTDAVRLERRGQVAEITLDRPKANAIDALTSRALGEAFLAFRDDDELRVAIITGGGERIFSAGWDLRAAAEHGEDESTDYGRGGFAGLTELFDLNKPVIAAVNGVAVGGGFELALACDLIVAAEHAEFFFPETRIGVLADAGGVQRLPRRLPYFIAMEMLLTGRRMGAAEAAGYGLVNAVVPGAEVMAKARELAATIAAGAPLAVQAIKEVVRGIEAASVEDAFAAVASRSFPVYARMLTSEDHEEGPRAFAEKREPNFKGR